MEMLGQKVVLFSNVDGVITMHHKPLGGARVLRSVKWKDKVYRDEVKTGPDGSFKLPAMMGPGRIVLAEFVAHQTIAVEHQGKQWEIWGLTKRSEELNQELVDKTHVRPKGVPIEFSCELTESARYIELLGGVLETSCRFKVEVGEVVS
jgi:hypothetical protein